MPKLRIQLTGERSTKLDDDGDGGPKCGKFETSIGFSGLRKKHGRVLPERGPTPAAKIFGDARGTKPAASQRRFETPEFGGYMTF